MNLGEFGIEAIEETKNQQIMKVLVKLVITKIWEGNLPVGWFTTFIAG